MIHSFNLNSEEEKMFQEIVRKEKNKSESAIIRDRIFRRRERNTVKVEVIDLKFLSTISNLISSIKDNNDRGQRIEEDLEELGRIVETKLSKV